MIHVLFFGPVADRAGISTLSVDPTPGLSIGALRENLAALYPEAFALVSLIAVNGAHARDLEQVVNDGAEVVFMSKFSGG